MSRILCSTSALLRCVGLELQVAALTTKISVRDRDGRVVEEKEVVLYAGLLARAHEEGLSEIETTLVQVPSPDNGLVAIASARVRTDKGVFTGIGDASPESVGRKILPHLIRMAETRAKARALRDAVNIGMVCLDELGDLAAEGTSATSPDAEASNVRPLASPAAAGRAATPRASEPPMTEAQRRLLLRLLEDNGFEGERGLDELVRRAQVDAVDQIGKRQASQLIDSLRRAA